MKWRREGSHLIVSNTSPPYKVARYAVGEQRRYRASYRGEFIGPVTDTAKAAQAICVRHHTTNQEAQET